ncbi:MAG: Cof-type HAD-IIB family hydrolase [Segetibacter sp.]
MYKAVFIDLDGTLLRSDHSISEATRDKLQNLVAKGILVVLVSARPFHGITPISNWLGTRSLPIVSLNGAYIGLDDQIIFESGIDPDTIADLHDLAASFDVTLIYYSGLEWFAEIHNAAVTKEQRITEIPVTIAPFPVLLDNWKMGQRVLNKVMAIGRETVIEALQARLRSAYQDKMNIYTSKPTYLEIMRRDASKSNAVKYLLARYDIGREEIIAIGDNYNDQEMIAFAGTGVAMGNAPAAIKAVADYITDTNEFDGVRKAIEKFNV